jgi:hypothetical protein
MMLYGFAMHALARQEKDSFAIATIAGAGTGYLAIAALTFVLYGVAPGLNFGHPGNLSDLLICLAGGALIGALYYAIGIRGERK